MVEIQETKRQIDSLGDESLLIVAGVPAYNEEKTIAKIVLSAQKYVDIVVVCDDGSSDLTGLIAERLGAVVVRHERNLGYGAALQSLFSRARQLNADVLVTLDSDGQHDPADIPKLVKPIEEGVAAVVLGSRFLENSGTVEMPAYRQFGVKVITRLSNSSGKNAISDSQSGFRAYSRVALGKLKGFSESGMSVSIELIRAVNKTGLKVCEVPISCKYGVSLGTETSTEHPLSHGIGLVMSLIRLVVEERPIALLGIPGVVFLSAGILFGIWLVNLYAQLHEIITNIALASIGLVLIGFFMISTAITLYAISKVTSKVAQLSK